MLHILFKDFSSSVSQLSPNTIPTMLLDAFCSFLSVIYFPYSSLHALFARTILSPWEWSRHELQCSSPPGINKSGLSYFSTLSPVPSEGGEMLSHSVSPPQVPPKSLFFLVTRCVPRKRPGFYLMIGGTGINQIINAGIHQSHPFCLTGHVHSTLSYSHHLILGLFHCPPFCCNPLVFVFDPPMDLSSLFSAHSSLPLSSLHFSTPIFISAPPFLFPPSFFSHTKTLNTSMPLHVSP